MLCVVLLSVLALTNGAAVEKRGLQTLDTFSQQTFTQLFRQTLLDVIAVEWNRTVDLTHALSTKMTSCNVKINATVDKCMGCAKSACQVSPTILDYLQLANPYTYLEAPLADMASKFSDAADLVGDKAAGFFNSMKDMASSGVGTVADGFTAAFNAVKDAANQVAGGLTDAGNAVIDTGSLIGDGFKDLGNGIGDGLSSAGHEVEHIGSSIGHAISGLFGRKREIDANTRKCMEKCTSCKPLLATGQHAVINGVCGGEIVQANNTINTRVSKIKRVYDATLDKVHPVLSKLEFDPTSMNAHMELATVYVTVRLDGANVRYKTAVSYSMMNMPDTARRIALEYWTKSG